MTDQSTKPTFEEMTRPVAAADAADYEAWKRAKVQAALRQADAGDLVDADAAWVELGLEH